MEIETLFTEQRWNILSLLSKEKLSPLQMSNLSNTTIANISQQLRLLEAANLVQKEKIKNRDKGKPRTMFSLADQYAYLVTTMDNFADKKLLVADNFKKFVLRAFFTDNTSLHYPLVRFYHKFEPYLSQINAILLNSSNLTIVSDKPSDLKSKINFSGLKFPENIKLNIISNNEVQKITKKGDFEVLYDPKNLLDNQNKE